MHDAAVGEDGCGGEVARAPLTPAHLAPAPALDCGVRNSIGLNRFWSLNDLGLPGHPDHLQLARVQLFSSCLLHAGLKRISPSKTPAWI